MSTPSLEGQIAELFGYGHAVLFGRARSGLTAILDTLGAAGEPVVVPSNLCPAVIAALAAAQARPLLAPVSPRSGLAGDDRLLAAMATEAGRGVVMPTHLYGLWEDCPQTCAEAKRRGWFVLENDTLGAAIRRDGKRVAFGDALLVSFNFVKTIEAGIGGAVLTDDPALAHSLTARARSWPPLSPQDDAVEHHLTLARRHLRALDRESVAEQLLDVDAAHTRHALPEAARPRISAALAAYPAAIARRWQRLTMWRQELAECTETFPEAEAPVVMPWRHVRWLKNPEQRPALLQALRAQGIDAGANFPPLTQGFAALLAGQQHPDADLWGQSVVNLWLTDDYDAERIAAAAAIIRDVLAKGKP